MAERGKIFKEAPILTPDRSWFDLSYENTFSMNMGECVPCALLECLPGDHFKAKTDSLTRFSPMLAPVMTSVNQFSYHFFVRMRDIWTNFDKFITNNDQKATWQQVNSFTPPTMPYFKPRSLLYGTFINSAINNTNFETGNLIYSSEYGYRLVIQVLYNSGAVDSVYQFIDHAQTDAVNLPIESMTYVFHFKPNPSEFFHDYSVGSNGIANDLYRINWTGSGSLLDYLGLDFSGVYQTQLKFFEDAIKEVKTAHSMTAADYSIANLISILNNPDNTVYSSAPAGYDVSAINSTEKPQIDDFDGDLETFINTHAIYEVDVMYHTDSAHAGFSNPDSCICVNTVECYKYKNPTQTSSSGQLSTDFSAVVEDPLCILPLRAYRFIYDEYFRDENYIPVNAMTDFSRDGDEFQWLGSSPTTSDLNIAVDYLSCFRKAWEHDPYTTALPAPQRGQAVHFLPEKVAVKNGNGASDGFYMITRSGTNSASGNVTGNSFGGKVIFSDSSLSPLVLQPMSDTTLQADLSAATIENFRWANSMQKYLEKKARTGGRYYEYLLGIWNKSVDDSKLNRPIYLSGDRAPVQVSEVLQTSSTNGRSALGDMAGRAIALGNDEFIEYEVPDYGYFMEITSVIPRVAYQQGVNPALTRENYLDFPLPDFAQLGEEYVKQKELYYLADSSKDNKAFGYQSRYYQWKYKRSEVHGEFKDSLDYWHFGRKFDSAPVAGKKFLEVNPDYRQFAVTFKGFQHLYCQMWHDIQMNRALPEFGVPVL